MFKTDEDRLAIKKLNQKQLLSMYRNVLTKISRLSLDNLEFEVSAGFRNDSFTFSVTAFVAGYDNRTFTIYDFWEIKKSEVYVSQFMDAIRTDDFENVKQLSEIYKHGISD